MLTQTTEHALRALLHLGRLAEGERAAVGSIARATGVPPAYLAKVLQALAGRGWVESRLGRTGGYALRRPLREVRIADLVEQFGGSAPGGLCLLGNRPCDPGRPCSAHTRWSVAQRAARSALGDLRLAELLEDQRPQLVQLVTAAPSIGSHETTQATIEAMS
jgi:Rrf2 family protein